MGPENCYGDPGQRPGGPTKVTRGVIELSKRLGIPMVATNDVTHVRQEHSEAQEILLCIQTTLTMDDPTRMRLGPNTFHLRARRRWPRFSERCRRRWKHPASGERCNLRCSSTG